MRKETKKQNKTKQRKGGLRVNHQAKPHSIVLSMGLKKKGEDIREKENGS